MLVGMDSETYRNQVVFENWKKVIYVVLLRAIYGIILADLLFYKKCFGDLENIVFGFNHWDPCVANRIKVANKHTARFHMDDAMSSHVIPKVNDKLKEWMNLYYCKHVEVNSNRGKLHYCLEMNFDFTENQRWKLIRKTMLKELSMSYQLKSLIVMRL